MFDSRASSLPAASRRVVRWSGPVHPYWDGHSPELTPRTSTSRPHKSANKMSPAHQHHRFPIPPRNPRSPAAVAPHLPALRNSASSAPLRYPFGPPQSSIFNSRSFIALQNPRSATLLFSHLYKSPGCGIRGGFFRDPQGVDPISLQRELTNDSAIR